MELGLSLATGLLIIGVSPGNAFVLPALLLGAWAIANFQRGRGVTSPILVQMRGVVSSVLLPLAAAAMLVGFTGTSDSLVPVTTCAVVGAAIVSGICRLLRWQLQTPVRTLLVGDRMAISAAADRWKDATNLVMVGAILVEPDLAPADIPATILGVPVVGGLEQTPDMVEALAADLVVVSPGPSFTAIELRRLSRELEDTTATLGVLGILDSVAPHRIKPGVINGATVQDIRPPKASPLTRIGKEIFDRVAGLLLFAITAPLLMILVVAVRLDSKGPGLFRQARVGKDGKEFTVYKLRTMVENADDIKASLHSANEFDDVLFKMRRDPRVTRVGALLRRTSLDELPQLINVLRGEMSLVGPRPNLPSEIAQMEPDTLRRLRVKPGITGLWQVSGRSDLPWEKAAALDTYYADNWGLIGDAGILFRTAKAVFTGRGAY
ncbi:MAG: sugar transferase [Nocardioidaceae bacterium]